MVMAQYLLNFYCCGLEMTLMGLFGYKLKKSLLWPLLNTLGKPILYCAVKVQGVAAYVLVH